MLKNIPLLNCEVERFKDYIIKYAPGVWDKIKDHKDDIIEKELINLYNHEFNYYGNPLEGIYLSKNLNINHNVDLKNTKFEDNLKDGTYTEYPSRVTDQRLYLDYGVCDNYEQILNYKLFGDLTIRQFIAESELNFCIALTPIYKKNQSKDGGWRWHKWGKYIGNHHIQYEYLYDEDLSDINQEYVYVFRIFAFKI